MRFNFVGGAVNDIQAAARGFPAGAVDAESFVGVRDPAVVFVLCLGSADLPELLDEVLALGV